MARPMTRTARLLTWALTLALGFVPSATCLLGAEVNAAQNACSAAMNHDGGDTAVEQDCCVADSPNPGLAGPLIAPLEPPSVGLMSTLASRLQPTAPFLGRPVVGADGPHSTRPTYLFDSVFRL